MMRTICRLFIFLLALPLVAAVPRHVQTADYWHGYAGTMVVSPQDAALYLSWVETGVPGAQLIKPLGVKPIMYTNPNRIMPGDRLYADNDDLYAHTCDGRRARGEAGYKGLLLTNPNSATLANAWRDLITNGQRELFSGIFADDANGSAYAGDQPCGFSMEDWIQGENRLFRSAHAPIIYNGLNLFHGHDVSDVIALNAEAIGGMMEECYAQLSPDHRVNGWVWTATEQTEIRMARDHRYFFCYGRDLTPADQAYDSRMYTYASFLLTYDPNSSVLWEYYKTPSGGHVMPESQLVPWHPVTRNITNIEQLRTEDGMYARAYRQCYLAGKPQGACVAVVNPDDSPHSLSLPGYSRTLSLQGSGVFDGGSVRVQNAPPPGTLGPRGAIIAFR